MTKFGISNSPLTDRIFVGRLNKKGDTYLEKQDMTVTALWATIEHVMSKNESGENVAISDDDFRYSIAVTKVSI